MPLLNLSSRFAAGCAALALLALAAPAPAQEKLDVVTVGAVSSVSDAPFIIAARKGFFRDAGIDVHFESFASGALMIAPLGNGQLDAGGGAPSAGLYNALARGIGIEIVADRGTDAPGFGFSPLVVRKDLVASGRYKTPADLKGLKIAEPAKGASAGAELVHLLAENHLGYDDVQHAYLAFPDQVAALKNGSIDGTIALEPWATQAEREGVATRVADDASFYPNQQIAVVLFSSAFAHQRPDVARRFMVGYLRAVRYWRDATRTGHLAGPAGNDVVTILSQDLHLDPAILRAMTPGSIDVDGRINVKSLESDYETYRKLGYVTQDVAIAKLIDTSFADAASKQLGPYRAR
jgi:NitT/TauT family transport system substrate-binding protein